MEYRYSYADPKVQARIKAGCVHPLREGPLCDDCPWVDRPQPVVESRVDRVDPFASVMTCLACSGPLHASSGGKWQCRACGFLLTCCD